MPRLDNNSLIYIFLGLPMEGLKTMLKIKYVFKCLHIYPRKIDFLKFSR